MTNKDRVDIPALRRAPTMMTPEEVKGENMICGQCGISIEGPAYFIPGVGSTCEDCYSEHLSEVEHDMACEDEERGYYA